MRQGRRVAALRRPAMRPLEIYQRSPTCRWMDVQGACDGVLTVMGFDVSARSVSLPSFSLWRSVAGVATGRYHQDVDTEVVGPPVRHSACFPGGSSGRLYSVCSVHTGPPQCDPE